MNCEALVDYRKIFRLLDTNKHFIVAISYLSNLLARLLLFPLENAAYVITIVNIILIIISLVYYLVSSEKIRNTITERNIALLPVYLVLFFTITGIELINFNSMSYLKLPFMFLLTTISLMLTTTTFFNIEEFHIFLKNISEKQVYFLIYAILLSLVVILLNKKTINFNGIRYSTTDYYLGISLGQYITNNGNMMRYGSFFSNVNHFADYAFLTVGIYSIFNNNKRNIYIVNGLFLLVILLTKTRTALVSYLILILFSSYFKKNKYQIKYGTKIFFAMILGTLMFFIYLTYFREIDSGTSMNARTHIWRVSINLFKGRPIVGLGTRTFSGLLGFAHAHNSFVQLLGSGGLVYFFSYIIMFFDFVKKLNYLNDVGNEDVKKYTALIFSFVLASFSYQITENRILSSHFHFSVLLLFYLYTRLLYYHLSQGRKRLRPKYYVK